MHESRYARRATVLAVAFALVVLFVATAQGATREPLARALHEPSALGLAAGESSPRPGRAALNAIARARASRGVSGEEFAISSTYYGPAEIDSVAATLRSLDHGPELGGLSVYVATPAEIQEECGTAVVACYAPAEARMVVSGVDRPVAGIPRDFAIAHEYGHHIANSRQGSALPALTAGTIRWATYERVCQLTRAGRLFPGDQGAHYWEDPEEAFAQSYADLNRPGAGVSWQYMPLLRPSAASLAKIHIDIVHPWTGPTTFAWGDSLAPSGTSTRSVETPLDGPVSVSLTAAPGVVAAVVLREPGERRVLARAVPAADGTASLVYSSCGHSSLQLEVRGGSAAGGFEAAITRP